MRKVSSSTHPLLSAPPNQVESREASLDGGEAENAQSSASHTSGLSGGFRHVSIPAFLSCSFA